MGERSLNRTPEPLRRHEPDAGPDDRAPGAPRGRPAPLAAVRAIEPTVPARGPRRLVAVGLLALAGVLATYTEFVAPHGPSLIYPISRHRLSPVAVGDAAGPVDPLPGYALVIGAAPPQPRAAAGRTRLRLAQAIILGLPAQNG